MPFRFGVAIPGRIFMHEPNDSTRLVEQHFSSLTAENEMKPFALQPKEGEFHWDVADRFVAFGEKNKMNTASSGTTRRRAGSSSTPTDPRPIARR